MGSYTAETVELDDISDYERRDFFYDTPEQIKMCLNCSKPECNNCLGEGKY